MALVHAEVEKKCLDLHDVAHRVGGDALIAGKGRFERRLEVALCATDQ
jgi:hypothetical protein